MSVQGECREMAPIGESGRGAIRPRFQEHLTKKALVQPWQFPSVAVIESTPSGNQTVPLWLCRLTRDDVQVPTDNRLLQIPSFIFSILVFL